MRTKSFGIALLRVWDCEDEGFFFGDMVRLVVISPPPHPQPPVVESANFTGTVNTPLAIIRTQTFRLLGSKTIYIYYVKLWATLNSGLCFWRMGLLTGAGHLIPNDPDML